MDDKRAIAAKTPSAGENSFPPFSLCGAVPLRHIHPRTNPATAEISANPLLAVAPPMLVYDGSCGFCSRAVQFILRHEQRHDLLFVPRESDLGKDLRRTYHLETVESLLWIADGHAAIESSAALNAAKYLDGVWYPLAAIASLVPAPLRNWGYRLIARNRRRFSSAAATCLVPTPDQRERFLG